MPKKTGKTAGKKSAPSGTGGWIAHVKSVAKSKNISYKKALSVASASYKKKPKK